MLNVRHFIVAVIVSPAVVFLLFLGVFDVWYVNWARQHTAEIAATHLSAQSGYTIRIDSVAVSLSALVFFKVQVLDNDETIGEVQMLVLHEPSLLRLLAQQQLVARRVEVGIIQTTRDEVRKLFEEQALFSDTPTLQRNFQKETW